jgi:hypothetical protein
MPQDGTLKLKVTDDTYTGGGSGSGGGVISGQSGTAVADLETGTALPPEATWDYQYATPFVLVTFTAPTTDTYYLHTVGSAVKPTEVYAWEGLPVAEPIDSGNRLSAAEATHFEVDQYDYASLELALTEGVTYTFGVVDKWEENASGLVSLTWQSKTSGTTGWLTPPVTYYRKGFTSYGNNYGWFRLTGNIGYSDWLAFTGAPRSSPINWTSNPSFQFCDQNSSGSGHTVAVTQCFGTPGASDDWRTRKFTDDMEWLYFADWEEGIENEFDRLEVTSSVSRATSGTLVAGTGVRTFALHEALPVTNATAESGGWGGGLIHDAIAPGGTTTGSAGPTVIPEGHLQVADDGKWSVSVMLAPVVYWETPPSGFIYFNELRQFATVNLFLQRPRYKTFAWSPSGSLPVFDFTQPGVAPGTWRNCGISNAPEPGTLNLTDGVHWHTCDNNEPPPPGSPAGDGGAPAGWAHVSWMRRKDLGPGSGRTGRLLLRIADP